MDFELLINELLEENMSEEGFKLWTAVLTKITPIWTRPTSSTGKYHNKADGRVPTVAEHTYEMLDATVKVMRMYDAAPKSREADLLLLGISLHDAWKYGENPNGRFHTANAHDLIAAQMIRKNKDAFLKLFSEEQFEILVNMLDFHQGRWSTNAKNINNFSFSNYHPYVHFLHTLDMLSSNNRLYSPNDFSKSTPAPRQIEEIPPHAGESYTTLFTTINGLKVKIDSTLYDSNNQPILLFLSDQDKYNIANMSPEATKYCAYPDHLTPESIKEWMHTEPLPTNNTESSNAPIKQEQNIEELPIEKEFDDFMDSFNLDDISI